jgi:hypothetical protein
VNRLTILACAAAAAATLALPAAAQSVKVTPRGGIDGEFCVQDRALVFEDPNGTRVLHGRLLNAWRKERASWA